MDSASRADAPSTADRGEPTDVDDPDRMTPTAPGPGIGLPHIRARSATAPAPVPSIDELPEPGEVTPTGVDDAIDGPAGVAVAPAEPQSFPPGVGAKLGSYVYLLVDPRTGRPFFVGRGRGDRCHRHVQAARATPSSDDMATKYPVLDRIRESEAGGRPVRVEILRHGLTPAEAELVEASVADALGLGHETRLGGQRGPAVDVGAALAKRAKIKRTHQVVLLRVGSHGAPADYDTARHGWRIGRRWIDTGSIRSPRWALLVTGDLVEAVFRIEGWEPTLAATAGGVERFSFRGTPDPELDARYAGRSVAGYRGTGTPTAVTYVWCGPHWVNTAH